MVTELSSCVCSDLEGTFNGCLVQLPIKCLHIFYSFPDKFNLCLNACKLMENVQFFSLSFLYDTFARCSFFYRVGIGLLMPLHANWSWRQSKTFWLSIHYTNFKNHLSDLTSVFHRKCFYSIILKVSLGFFYSKTWQFTLSIYTCTHAQTNSYQMYDLLLSSNLWDPSFLFSKLFKIISTLFL